MNTIYFKLLQDWADGLIKHQIKGMNNSVFDGGILCPACKHIHGRCPDAIYAMMYLADRTGDKKYLDSARGLFNWQSNMLCDDGTLYNDANSSWNGITEFAAVGMHEALFHHGHLLEASELKQWEERLLKMTDWIVKTVKPGYRNNINYIAAGAAVLALLGNYFKRPDFTAQARELADYVMDNFTSNGLLCGEGLPHDTKTKRGCRPIDIGYNVEESVPLLIRYALAVDDNATLEKLCTISRQQIDFMLPDGGWDNSFGSRNAKWTYWGSRTSDGCQTGYALLADKDPLFAEADYRSTELMASCTHDGLLYGGPEYLQNGEPPCVHHTFTHINAIAAAMEAGIEKYQERVSFPIPPKIKYFPELDAYKLCIGDWRATVTGYDFAMEKGHASGGTMTLLWHEKAGVVLLSSVVDYLMLEPLNMQLSLQKGRHRPLTPRIEKFYNGERFSQCYDTNAEIQVYDERATIRIGVKNELVSLSQNSLPSPVFCKMEYLLTEKGLIIDAEILEESDDVRFVLPVISDNVKVITDNNHPIPEKIFFLTGGFSAREYVLEPDKDGKLRVEICVC